MAAAALGPGRIIWPLVPTATVVAGMVLSLLPFGLNGLIVTPAFALVPIFFWAIHRPPLLPPFIVFALGLTQDFATFGPIGLWAVVFLIAYSVTLWQSSEIAGMPMRYAWAAFGGVVLAALLGGWFAASVYNSRFLAIAPVFVQALTTSAVLPLFAWLLVIFEREIAATSRH